MMFDELKSMRSDIDHLVASDIDRCQRKENNAEIMIDDSHEEFPPLRPSTRVNELNVQGQHIRRHQTSTSSEVVKNGTPLKQNREIIK